MTTPLILMLLKFQQDFSFCVLAYSMPAASIGFDICLETDLLVHCRPRFLQTLPLSLSTTKSLSVSLMIFSRLNLHR